MKENGGNKGQICDSLIGNFLQKIDLETSNEKNVQRNGRKLKRLFIEMETS